MACTLPHVRPNSPSSLVIVLRQVVFDQPLFLFPVGVHLKAILGILSLGILGTWPSHRSLWFIPSVFLYSSSLVILLCQYILQIIDLSHISFRYSPARRAIHKESLTNAVIRPDRSFEAILLSYRLPDVASRMKAHVAVLRRAVMSLWAPLSLLIRLPR